MAEIIKVEPFLIKKGNRVGKAAVQFTDGLFAGFHMIGFTICEDKDRGLYVLFPSSTIKPRNESNRQMDEKARPYFFLKPDNPDLLDKLETAILDAYDKMVATKA